MNSVSTNMLIKKLSESGEASAGALSEAPVKARQKGMSLPHFLIETGVIPKKKLYDVLADIYGVPFVDLGNFQISPDALKAIPSELAHRYKVMPLFKIGNTINVAMEDPVDMNAIDQLRQRSRCEIDPCLGAQTDIENALNEHYGSSNEVHQLLQSLTKERTPQVKDDKKTNSNQITKQGGWINEHPVVKLVNLILREAYEKSASDIHVEPEEKILRIRLRIDGVLQEASTPPKELESEIISRIKVLAQMDIAETRIPQDGRIKMDFDGKSADMRVSSVPTVYGENIAIRLLKDSEAVFSLQSLGLNEQMRAAFEKLIKRPYGMILETGPTGSGKTTTLYAALNRINTIEKNIVTIEDPVEYKLPMIRQIPVNVKAGLGFAQALRSILRQDPDVIMVGEIRDKETVEIAVQSALTGHLVFSTLHANSAAGVITRLLDMKIEPFLVSSAVIGILSQRLVRKICERCKIEDKASKEILESVKEMLPGNFTAFKGRGCRFCNNTGSKGRIGIFELATMQESLQKKVLMRASTDEIEQEMKSLGFKTMREDAFDKVGQGIISLEEAMKAVDMVNL